MISVIKKINTRTVLVLVFLSVTWINFNLVRWHSHDVINSDVAHYYSYLPAAFYEHDLSLSFIDDTVNVKQDLRYYAPKKTPGGKHVIKMSMGMAITYLPFFALAHLYATVFHYAPSGFSEPYHFAVLFSSLIYFLLGLFFLSRLLRFFFTESITVLVLLCLSFGTNILHYLTLGGGMSHVTNFALISMFLYYCIRWHRQPSMRLALIIGCLLGLITLIRPINLLLILFFLFYDITSVTAFKAKLRFLFSQSLHLCIIAGLVFLIFLPQLLYWKFISGHYLFNSYTGERFYFQNPHVIDGLFSFRKGWLVYTPLMLFSLAGFFCLKGDRKKFLLPTLILLLVYIYVAFSWWCWWYGGSFGQRAMIDIYPVLAIPLAAFYSVVGDRHKVFRISVYILTICFVLLNAFQTIQSRYNIIHYDSMTRENYVEVFFTTSKKADRETYLKHPDYEKARRGEDEY